MIRTDIISGVKVKMTPLISFHAIVDIDVGLINLIKQEYLDERIFNKDFFTQPIYAIIADLYYRKERNPLLVFAKNKKDTETLNGYYEEFLERCYPEIIDKSVSTELLPLIETFNQTQEIRASILYYRPEELEALEQIPELSSNPKILLKTMSMKEKNEKYGQFFLKTIEEADPFCSCKSKTFYFSASGINLTETNDDIKDSDILGDIMKNHNAISIFDLYKKDIIKRRTE